MNYSFKFILIQLLAFISLQKPIGICISIYIFNLKLRANYSNLYK